jgi:hypothetical protein
MYLLRPQAASLELSRKQEIIPLSQVNLSSATTEELFERIAWFPITAKHTIVYDATGNCHQLSKLTHLSPGKIPFTPRFAQMYDYEQRIPPTHGGTKSVM